MASCDATHMDKDPRRLNLPHDNNTNQGGPAGREQLIPGAMPRHAAQPPPVVEPPSEEAIQTLMVRVVLCCLVFVLLCCAWLPEGRRGSARVASHRGHMRLVVGRENQSKHCIPTRSAGKASTPKTSIDPPLSISVI
jgi:hypothetical protein